MGQYPSLWQEEASERMREQKRAYDQHNDGCWQRHHACAIARMERAEQERDSARAWARLWKRAAMLNRMTRCRKWGKRNWYWARSVLTYDGTRNTDGYGRTIRRALGLDNRG